MYVGVKLVNYPHLYYFSHFTHFTLLTHGEDMAKKKFFVRKPQRNLKGFWSKLDIIGVTDDFGGLLSEVYKFCRDNIYCITDPRVPAEDLVQGQNVFVYFPLGTPENNFLFLM